ncbi:MFS transporter [Streptomyces mashuensis]|uniref:MFS transporter n=1 Tax=Streptomyces mashuensis TaxID=33904 RepID=A0A919EEM6_9ACTN|nr:MFS transporter [Streptomyces mashuensis]GHF55158.1 MFS transporter [Streptomyces mashuensis]
MERTPLPPEHGGRLPLPVFALAAATFCVVTAEMLPVGLLTPLSAGLGVSDGTMGLAVTLPGLTAALAAPLLPVAVRHADRRRVLCGLMLLLALAGLAPAVLPSFGVLMAARLVVGVCIGGVWAVAAGLGARLVPGPAAGRATAVVFSGIAVASVAGVPAGTLLGELAGWRWTFAAAGALALVVAGLLAAALPALPADEAVRLRTLAGTLRVPRIRSGLLVVAALVTGHFAAYTYVRPVLREAGGIGAGAVGAVLLLYGLAGVAGTFAGGAAAARAPRRTLLVLSTAIGATVLALTPLEGRPLPAIALLAVWGLAYGGVSVSAQSWLTAAAPKGRGEAVSALFAGVFNAAIAAGALGGGRAVDAFGVRGPLWCGGALAMLATVVLVAGRLAGRRMEKEDTERTGRNAPWSTSASNAAHRCPSTPPGTASRAGNGTPRTYPSRPSP